MASTYALPLNSGTHFQHGHHHSRSYNHVLLGERSPSWAPHANSAAVKKTPSTGSLHSQAQTHSFLPINNTEQVRLNGRAHFSPPRDAMKARSRARGESDLGRPAVKTNHNHGNGLPPVAEAYHHHDHAHGEKQSRLTKYLLDRCHTGSILHSILLEKDSRRIAYFAV